MSVTKDKFSKGSLLRALGLGLGNRSQDNHFENTVFQDTVQVDPSLALPSEPPAQNYEAMENWHYLGRHVAGDGKRLMRRLHIRFIDKAGQITERDIDTKHFLTDGRDGVIHAYCHLRQADQCFSMSRISALVDLETGETQADIPAWFLTQHAQSQRG
jgi:hypothetical protein